MTQQNPVQKDTQLHKQVAELQKRVDVLEDILDSSKEVLTVEEAAKFMGMARSSLYKMTCEHLNFRLICSDNASCKANYL